MAVVHCSVRPQDVALLPVFVTTLAHKISIVQDPEFDLEHKPPKPLYIIRFWGLVLILKITN